jgi:hypothetical protein
VLFGESGPRSLDFASDKCKHCCVYTDALCWEKIANWTEGR